MAYLVVHGVSVRVSRDKGSPEYEQFLDWRPGATLDDYPEHADIDGWLASGHIVPAAAPSPRRGARRE